LENVKFGNPRGKGLSSFPTPVNEMLFGGGS